MQWMQLSSWIISDKNGSSVSFFGWHLQKLTPGLSREIMPADLSPKSAVYSALQVASNEYVSRSVGDAISITIVSSVWYFFWALFDTFYWYFLAKSFGPFQVATANSKLLGIPSLLAAQPHCMLQMHIALHCPGFIVISIIIYDSDNQHRPKRHLMKMIQKKEDASLRHCLNAYL